MGFGAKQNGKGETSDIQTYIFVKENIAKYQLNIDISSKALKNKMIEIIKEQRSKGVWN